MGQPAATPEEAAEALWAEARRRLGDARADAIKALGLGLPTGLAIVASAALTGDDEPDYLTAEALEAFVGGGRILERRRD